MSTQTATKKRRVSTGDIIVNGALILMVVIWLIPTVGLLSPGRSTRYGLRRGSGGAGRHRGGEGIFREYEFLVPAALTIMSERRRFAPYGLRGGGPGRPGRNTLVSRGRKRALGSKVNVKVRPGDILTVETPGGGGYGRKRRRETRP